MKVFSKSRENVEDKIYNAVLSKLNVNLDGVNVIGEDEKNNFFNKIQNTKVLAKVIMMNDVNESVLHEKEIKSKSESEHKSKFDGIYEDIIIKRVNIAFETIANKFRTNKSINKICSAKKELLEKFVKENIDGKKLEQLLAKEEIQDER